MTLVLRTRRHRRPRPRGLSRSATPLSPAVDSRFWSSPYVEREAYNEQVLTVKRAWQAQDSARCGRHIADDLTNLAGLRSPVYRRIRASRTSNIRRFPCQPVSACGTRSPGKSRRLGRESPMPRALAALFGCASKRSRRLRPRYVRGRKHSVMTKAPLTGCMVTWSGQSRWLRSYDQGFGARAGIAGHSIS